MIISPESAVSTWEIWLFAPGDYREQVEPCGLFRADASEFAWRTASPAEADANARRAATRAAADAETWLHTGVWSDRLNPDMFALREGLKALGIDPAAADVRAVERCGQCDSQVEAPLGSRYHASDEDAEPGEEETAVLAAGELPGGRGW